MLAAYFDDKLIEAGCDEAGRGCLAGPVFAAAVIFDKSYHNPELDDSKKLTEKKRYRLRERILEDAVSWCVEKVDAEEIDRINILNASFLAMTKAVEGLSLRPELLLIDGNKFRSYLDIPFRCIIKGDGKYQSIAAASILAKTFRDDYMKSLSEEFPAYGWSKNKGYGTRIHCEALKEYGLTEHHRKTFNKRYTQATLFP
ncbi:MAG: ribonuclease HII [Rikenellaceae bacterium]|nr:ribonuclease HII [Rikenellaceae bacterium]